MTGDEFRARYDLLDQVADGGVRSYNAVGSTGSVAMVHFLDGGLSPVNRALLAAVERLDPERRARVREVVAVGRDPVVVTDLLDGFRTLPEWLGVETASAAPSDAEAPPAKPAAPSASDAAGAESPAAPLAEAPGEQPVGEFTRLFRAAELRTAADAALSAASTAPVERPPPASKLPTAPAEPASSIGGDFTRQFRAMGAGDPPAVLDASSTSPAATPPGDSPPRDDSPAAGETEPAPSAEPVGSPVIPEAAPTVAAEPGPEPSASVFPSFRAPELAGPPPVTTAPPEPQPAGTVPEPEVPAWTPPVLDAESAGVTQAFSSLRPPPLEEPRKPPPPAGLGPAPGGGEFSQLFQRLEIPESAAPALGATRPLPPPEPFAGEARGQGPPLAYGRGPELPPDSYLDRLYAMSDTPDPAPAPAAAPGGQLAPLPPVFGTAPSPAYPAPPLPQPAAPLAQPSARGAAGGTGPLLAGLAVVAVLALALVLYFAFR